MSVVDAIGDVFARAGAQATVHACDIDGDAEVGIEPDAPVVLASTFKIAVLVELVRQAAAGDLALTDRVVVPASRRTVGPTGLSVMLDDADLSVRDLAFWMMCVSDNTATDVLMERLGGPARINATLRSLGLVETHLIGDCKVLLDGLMVELGIGPDLTIDDVTEGQLRGAVALQPEGTNHSTARDVTSLLSMIWRDEAAPPDACAEVRRIMALQVWPHRLTAGFDDGIRISAKTGTLPGIRNEAGVVELADGRRYAVAVFARSRSFAFRQPAVDAAIGTAARLAIDALSGA